MGTKAEQAEGLLKEVQLPAGPEGQAQLEELVEPPNPGSGPWPSLLSPSSGPPAHPTHVWAKGVRAACWAQAQQPTLGKDAGRQGHGHSQATSESCFSHPDTSPSTNRAPSGVYQNKHPNSQSAVPRRVRAAWAGGLQPSLQRVT